MMEQDIEHGQDWRGDKDRGFQKRCSANSSSIAGNSTSQVETLEA